MEKLITDSLGSETVSSLLHLIHVSPSDASFEILEAFQFLLITVRLDNVDSQDVLKKRSEIISLMNERIPNRAADYSWMVNFKNGGVLVESYFGGNSQAPDSGY